MSESIQDTLRVDEFQPSNPHQGEHESVNPSGQDQGNLEPHDNMNPAEKSARYFQSEKDKLYAENQQLKKYETIGKYLERNPQVAYGLANQIQGGQGGQPLQGQMPPQQQQQTAKTPPKLKPPEDFDPYEAYTNPNSESYKFRMKEQVQMADHVSKQRVGQAYNSAMQQQAMGNLVGELKQKFGYDDAKVAEFVKFANTPADQLGLEKVVQMFETVNPNQIAPEQNNLEQVRQTQQAPPNTGILQGERPLVQNPVDAVWRGVLGAQQKGSLSQTLKKQ